MTSHPTHLDIIGLRTAVARVLPHKAASCADVPLDGILLDFDGSHLHVVASDRFTLAIGRATAIQPAPAWTAYLDTFEVSNLHHFLELTDPRDPVALTRSYDEDEAPVLRLHGRHSSVTLGTQENPGYPDWRKLVATSLANPAQDEPVSFTPQLLPRWAAVGDFVTFSHHGTHNPVIVTADNFLGLQAPRRKQAPAEPGLDNWREMAADARKEQDVTDAGPLAQLQELAAGHLAATEEARAKECREQEERERGDAAARAYTSTNRVFPGTLGRALSMGSWRGYPDGQEGTGPMAVAHLGDGMFVTYQSRPVVFDAPWGGRRDVVILVRPCACGNYIETVVDDDYSLALTLKDAEVLTGCVGSCTTGEWPEED
ncbi:hypothetical protein IPZ58_15345 [Streptomyces roseoverticillatus]|uniref:hypothetical protein n=1 Tax=Streptomyces roseoverticillatus TaxID=66429 RepID=UPI001F40E5E1|nr:hypothetical protein [Streptomyces roseoverticillatus]MCF3102955.1 hypothetical protein [Streptomyces roseoverticillatus]